MSGSGAATAGYAGFQQPNSSGDDFSAQSFLVNQIIGRIATTALVKIVAVVNAGEDIAVGFVDVQPIVNQIDAVGNGTPHGIINNIPYFRLQGGTNAIILDPQVGDIGICVFCSRDISTVKRTKDVANPGSFRRNDWADGLYIGGVLNGVPAQFVRFSTDGIEIKSPTKVTITTPLTEITGELRVDGAVTAGFGTGDAVGVQTHTHAQPNDTAGDVERETNAPTAGT